jgi:hypothetical protein
MSTTTVVLGTPPMSKLSLLPIETPAVCSPWDKPGAIDLGRLSGLDLQQCAILIRTNSTEPAICSEVSLRALLSSQIICIGSDTTFANRDELEQAGLLVLEELALDALPRTGFCLFAVGDELHAVIRKTPWTD